MRCLIGFVQRVQKARGFYLDRHLLHDLFTVEKDNIVACDRV